MGRSACRGPPSMPSECDHPCHLETSILCSGPTCNDLLCGYIRAHEVYAWFRSNSVREVASRLQAHQLRRHVSPFNHSTHPCCVRSFVESGVDVFGAYSAAGLDRACDISKFCLELT
ncbi:hypothetical protein M758_4G107500 [Ceratodon purpureus]|nr:hypothetical protein M758_4G107500 [Ceratodon purpureus]